MAQLQLDPAVMDRARAAATRIARRVRDEAARKTTTSVERATLRLLGVDGVDENQVPLPNRVVDHLRAAGLLPHGAAP
ncbi:MAG: D-lysine 5,6-aminomutase subunit alpha, partial [Burkholderiales bacterium]|nr:D-lysine 5,6-aminomutase subunit alpha [Burkholderiales bacterium]